MINNYNKNEVKLFNEAIRCRDKKEYSTAIDILKQLLVNNPKSPSFNGILGGIYFDLKEYYKALEYFKKASNLNPKSELASTGYFHSLFELGYISGGLKEINRFLKLKYSSDYIEIIKELYKMKKSKRFFKYKPLLEKIYLNYVLNKSK